MVTYNYTVTSDGPTYSIQEAINRVASELSTNPTLTRDIVISVGDGVYSGFVIPDNALSILLASTYRLVIQSAGSFFPILDFNNSESLNVGIDIGSGNPNVTVSGFRIQYFPVGIRATLNSHYPVIKNCIVVNNRNVGILIEQCKQTQILQNIVVNGDYGIVVRLCKSAAIIHNTVFQNGAIATEKGKSISGIWAGLAMNYGAGLTDTGTLHILGNVIWNICGAAMTLFYDDVERPGALVSNFNDIVSGDPDRYIVIEDRRFYRGAESRPRRILTSLTEWKSLGNDLNSINEDPKFISPVKIRSDRNGYALDLNLLPISPVLGLVPSFFVNTTSQALWLPSYVDSSNLSKDILKEPRVQNGTSAGANDRVSHTSFYGQDILSNPLDLNTTKNCELVPLSDVVSNKIDIWFPTIKRGYFYSNEREYYLYSKKECKYLGELAVTAFRLPSKIATTKEYTIKVNGKSLSSEYFNIVGDDLYIYHNDTNIVNYNEEVDISYYTSNWKNGGFQYTDTHVVYKIKDGDTRYYLPSGYKAIGPVVVTDDKSAPTDSSSISNREYSLIFDPNEQLTELVFANNTNQILNGQFDYSIGQAPLLWESSGALVSAQSYPNFSVAGRSVCSLSPTGWISQTLKYDTTSTFSFHAVGTDSLNYSVHAYDFNLVDLGYVLTGSIDLSGSWNRYYLTLGSTGSTEVCYTPSNNYPLFNIGQLYIPQETQYLDFKLSNPSTSTILIDAVQYEKGSTPKLYHRKPFLNEITVEYESSTSDDYIDTHQSISPVRNYITDGFMYIPEVLASVYGGPFSNNVTTLHEISWPEGRKTILPWARTKGKDKLCYRPNNQFHAEPNEKPEIIVPLYKVPSVKDIFLSPNELVARQDDSNGVGLSITVVDENGNPSSLNTAVVSIVDPKQNFPGFLFKKTYGLKEQLGQVINTTLDNAGILNLVWIPPNEAHTTLSIKTPVPISRASGDRLAFIKTRYPVSLTNHGNVSILDYNQSLISTTSSVPIKRSYVPTKTSNTSQVRLPYPIKYASVLVMVDNIVYTETFLAAPESNQYYVDYEESKIILKGSLTNVYIEYVPSYVYTSKVDPYTLIVFFDKIFSGYRSEDRFTINHDCSIPLSVSILDPSTSSYYTKVFPLIARNSNSSLPLLTNPIGLEL